MSTINEAALARLLEAFADRNMSPHAPSLLDHDGREWAFATDGRSAIALYPVPQGWSESPCEMPTAERVVWPTEAGEALVTTAGALRSWCGDDIWPSEVDCTNCDGTGEDANGCDCPDCPTDNIHDCADCEGTGKYTAWPKHRAGIVRLVTIDCAILGRLLSPLADDLAVAVQATQAIRPHSNLLRIEADGGCVVLVLAALNVDDSSVETFESWLTKRAA